MRIYLDHNATSPPAPQVVDAAAAAMRDAVGNASSVHYFGQQARAAVDAARASVAALIGGDPSEVVFTSGGTEADNLAIRGVADTGLASGRTHLVVSAIEHEAVLTTVRALERRGWSVTLVPPDSSGVVEPARVAAALTPATALVSVMHANNEIGTVQPIAELAPLVHSGNAVFHVDAVQSAGKIPIDVGALGVDLLSISAHKFRGPKGVGALWIRRGTRLTATMTGGRQERSRRAGTENVPGIVGMGVAAELARAGLPGQAAVAALRDRLEDAILAAVPGTCVNGDRARRVPNTSSISFEGVDAEAMLIALDLEGIAVSTGAACSSGTLEPSHVLRAMGLSPQRVQSALRFSLGPTTTADEVERVVEVVPGVVERLRQLSRAGARRVR
jgi:cysteine desulfurase